LLWLITLLYVGTHSSCLATKIQNPGVKFQHSTKEKVFSKRAALIRALTPSTGPAGSKSRCCRMSLLSRTSQHFFKNQSNKGNFEKARKGPNEDSACLTVDGTEAHCGNV
jgi:hypothetical protein